MFTRCLVNRSYVRRMKRRMFLFPLWYLVRSCYPIFLWRSKKNDVCFRYYDHCSNEIRLAIGFNSLFEQRVSNFFFYKTSQETLRTITRFSSVENNSIDEISDDGLRLHFFAMYRRIVLCSRMVSEKSNELSQRPIIVQIVYDHRIISISHHRLQFYWKNEIKTLSNVVMLCRLTTHFSNFFSLYPNCIQNCDRRYTNSNSASTCLAFNLSSFSFSKSNFLNHHRTIPLIDGIFFES